MTCGRRAITRKPVVVRRRSGTVVQVMADVCGFCGEQYYDMDAMRKLEAADRPKLRRSA